MSSTPLNLRGYLWLSPLPAEIKVSPAALALYRALAEAKTIRKRVEILDAYKERTTDETA
jgi:hypothetical protein